MASVSRTRIIAAAGSTPISGASQPQYPWPRDRTLTDAEVAGLPSVIFDNVTIEGPSLGIDLRTFSSLRFVASTFNNVTLRDASQP